MRRLVVNADDFGQSPGINAGVIRSAEQGIVTSTSLMVRWPAAEAAAEYAAARPQLSVGLHVDLAEWSRAGGDWVARYRVVDDADPVAVESEIRRQLERFRKLTGRNPTHLDGHQHVQRSGHPGRVLTELAAELGVVLRDRDPAVRYEGGFYGRTPDGPYPQGVTAGRLIEILSDLPEGTTELGCHPGLGHDVDSDYSQERALEVEALCDPQVRRAIDRLGIELVSFSEVPSPSR
jgi:chitin disaccharide deacetylase